MSWSVRHSPPIPLPSGGSLKTLSDARAFILALSEQQQQSQPWLVATEALLVNAQHGGPSDLSRMGIMRALNGPRKPVPDAARKDRR